jgi:hypothetical protein
MVEHARSQCQTPSQLRQRSPLSPQQTINRLQAEVDLLVAADRERYRQLVAGCEILNRLAAQVARLERLVLDDVSDTFPRDRQSPVPF